MGLSVGIPCRITLSSLSLHILVHNIVLESRAVARTYVDVFDWLVSDAICDLLDLE